jgi:L-threonylcarbamoyladenylate synthase
MPPAGGRLVVAAGSPGALRRLIEVLHAGGVAIAPGDTMYGLIGIVPDAEGRIRRIKGRGEDKPFLQLIAEPSWISRISDSVVPRKISQHWPGPLTIVIPDRSGGTVAVRVPDSPFLLEVLRALDRPLYSTSVNRAGSPPLDSVEWMRQDFEAEVDIVVDAGNQPPGAPSTLLDITATPWRILRQGALRLSPEELS